MKEKSTFSISRIFFCKKLISRKKIFLDSMKSVDVLVACQPVISDGRLAPVLAQQWEHCLVLWATPEEQTGEMISGNSLVNRIINMVVFFFKVKNHLYCARIYSKFFLLGRYTYDGGNFETIRICNGVGFWKLGLAFD